MLAAVFIPFLFLILNKISLLPTSTIDLWIYREQLNYVLYCIYLLTKRYIMV